MLDSEQWLCAEPNPALAFELDGASATFSTQASRMTAIATAEGVVSEVFETALVLSGPSAVTLRMRMPPLANLRELTGQRVRVTLRDEFLAGHSVEQTLTIADRSAVPHLLAHHGRVRGVVHALGGEEYRATLSQRADGPLVFGTTRLQCVVPVGERIGLSTRDGSYVVHFLERTPCGHAAYVVLRDAMARRDDARTR